MSENIGKKEIDYLHDSFKIITHDKEYNKQFVDKESLTWRKEKHDWPGEDDVYILTLDEIAEQLTKQGHERVFYVWTEMGLSGKIYMWGNYDPPIWEHHGTTKGYA